MVISEVLFGAYYSEMVYIVHKVHQLKLIDTV